jgi:predicted RNA binding protein YcfA (HicA-like mRNA interferase family)
MTSREAIAALKADGWALDRVRGDHHQFRHPKKPGVVTVPHPTKDLTIGVLKSIEKQSGLRLRRYSP